MQISSVVMLLFSFLLIADAGVLHMHTEGPLVPDDAVSLLQHPAVNQSGHFPVADDADSELEHPAVDQNGQFLAAPKIKVRAAATRSVERGSKGVQGAKVLDVQCFQPFPGPGKNTRCPDLCPYMRFDPDRMCHFKCITKEWCLTAPNMPTSFPDEHEGRCTVCSVPGCRKCRSPTKCVEGECMDGFDMVDGECKPQSRSIWRVIFGVVGTLVLIIGIYLGVIWHRPVRQSMRLKLAQQYRAMSKLRKPSRGHPFYSLGTNLCKEMISGIGVLLHFRFQFFWLVWALIVLALCGMVSFYHGRFKAADTLAMTPTHEEVFRQCAKFDTDNAYQVYLIQKNFKYLTCFVYVATTIAVIGFSICQRLSYKRQEDQADTMEDYALCVYRLPVEKARDSLEEDYLKFFKSKWDGVLGVTICWDYADAEPQVIEAVTRQMHDEFDQAYFQHLLTDEEIDRLRTEKEDSYKALEEYRKRRSRVCIDPELRCLDDGILGTAQASDAGEVFTVNAANIQELISSLPTTGFVFVVFETEEKATNALRSSKESPVEYKGKELGVLRENIDPQTIIWTGFSVHRSERNANILKGICITLGVIVVWAVCFYGPYVVYIMSWSRVAGQSGGDATTMQLLGIMCAIGNQVVYFTCAKVADGAGFRSKDFAMAFNCCLYTAAVLINIIVDVSLMIVMAHGYQQDSGMDPTATIRNPSFSYALFLQLVGYLYPSTLLIPYLAEPLPMNIIPYFLGKWMVRSAIRVSRYEAEQAMVCPEFDLLRYGDILINVSTVIVCFFLASSSLWWIFMWLFVSNGIIYLWDHFRLLRQCEELYFSSDLMERCSQYISALPCALLAAAFVFKRYESRELLKSFERDALQVLDGDISDDLDDWRKVYQTNVDDISQHLWLTVMGVFVLHLAVHTFINAYVVPRFVPSDSVPSKTEYKECASKTPCCWFKSNPVHCLRSKNISAWKHDPPLIYHVRGKEYVHKANPAIYQYYEEPDFDPEQDMKESIKMAFASVKTTLGRGVGGMRRGPTTSKLGCVATPRGQGSARSSENEGGCCHGRRVDKGGTEHLHDDGFEEGTFK
jgi:hypothetical protein